MRFTRHSNFTLPAMIKRNDFNWPYAHHPERPDDRVLGERAPRFERHIYISKQQLFYDIDAQLAIISSSRKREDGTEDDNITNNSSKFRPMFNRWIDRYVSLARGRMAAFILEKFRSKKMNTISSADEIDIELSVPQSYDDTSFTSLVQAVHDYIVNGVLFEFLSLQFTPNDPVTAHKQSEMELAYGDIKRFVCSTKPGYVRKKLQPF